MYNEILDGITRNIYELFGEDCEIYTDAVAQGLKEPCFFVQFLEPSEKQMIGKRYFRKTDVCIQYIPDRSCQISRELNRTADILMPGMEYIRMKDGSMLRGVNRRTHMDTEEKVLSFFVSYPMFVIREKSMQDPMEEIKLEEGLVK